MKRTEQVHPKDDPAVKNLLQRMEPHIAESFTLEQLFALSRVVGMRNGRVHGIDLRATTKVPLFPISFYFVFVAGKNRRFMSSREKAIAVSTLLVFSTLVFIALSLLGLLMAYLLKSWLGINIFEDTSLGIWDWFKSL